MNIKKLSMGNKFSSRRINDSDYYDNLVRTSKILQEYRAEFLNACDDLYYGYGKKFWLNHQIEMGSKMTEEEANIVWKAAFERMSTSDSRRIKDNAEECELWVQHDVYKEPADDIDFDWDSVDVDELTPDQYIWGVNNQYRWEEPLYVDWNWSDDELVNYLIQIGFLNRGVTASDLNIDWDGANDMIILEQASDGMPLGYITKAY